MSIGVNWEIWEPDREQIFYTRMKDKPIKRKCPAKSWIKRFGAAGFIFFLIKGLLWLIVPTLVAYFSLN